MKILVLNSRRYSVEYEILDMPQEKIIAKGIVTRIGEESAIIDHIVVGKTEERIVRPVLSHKDAIDVIIEVLTDPVFGVIKDKKEISAIGHRVVHGGEDFHESVLIDKNVREKIYKNIDLAPLHNPYNLKAIDEALLIFPKIPHVAVFDTSFYQKMPEAAYYYAIPLYLYKKYKIRRYGFHGISHKYQAETASKILKKPLKNLKIISIHLGRGSSITAIKNGIPVDTSMGFTPLGGLVMTTRCGNIDPEVVIYLGKLGWKPVEIEILLNQESGILGVSGVSDNMKDVIEEAERGDKRSKLAIELFCYSVRKYLYAYSGILGGCDVITFSGGIAVNSPYIRGKILSKDSLLGIKIDKKKNEKVVGTLGRIDSSNSKVKVIVVPRNEGILIAREVFRILNRRKK